MNRFVDILNRIRQNADESWLTPSQKAAKEQIIKKLKFLDEVNLWGNHGVGKTFLGWIMWKQKIADYAPSKEYVPPPSISLIVVDNSGWKRKEVLEILHHCRMKGHGKVMFITNEPVQHSVASVDLKLTPEDLEKVLSNLRNIDVLSYADTPKNLWDIVSPVEVGGCIV